MSDYISRQDAYITLTAYYHHRTEIQHLGLKEALSRVPPADVRENERGKWEEREVLQGIIEEWQSAKCSVCGKYHTVPYTYYFSTYNFCPHCGADMRG